jgi:hypothetical protein
MYEPDDILELPKPNTVIWRFMSLPGLLSLLQRNQLFFGAMHRMSDPYEGALPEPVMNAYARWSGMSEDFQTHTATSDALRLLLRRMACINCWHANPVESAAMWNLYSPHHGIAIRSSIQRLIGALRIEQEQIRIGKVYYVDFSDPKPKDRDSYFRDWFVKRKSFEHEREIRALMDNYKVLKTQGSEQNCGTYAKVDVSVLVERIYVSPHVEQWVHDVVKQEVRLHGFPEVPIQQSDLRSPALG